MKNFLNVVKLWHKDFNFNILYIFFAAFILRIFLANFGTLELDHGTFVAWGNSLVLDGFNNFYNGWSDYLPGYPYILWLLAKISSFLPVFQVLIFKLPAILADLLTGYIIYLIASKRTKNALLFSLAYVFNPAIFANSTLWGQADSLTALFSLFAVYMFPKHVGLSAISLAIGTLIKPQAAFVLPAIFYLAITHKKKFIQLVSFAMAGLAIFILGFVPFQNKPQFIDFFLERLTVSSSQYPYGSINAFSFWGIFGFWKPDNITFWVGLGISILIISAVTIYMLLKKKMDQQYLIAGISFLATFIFMTRMHERHLLPTLPFMLLSALEYPVIAGVYASLSLTYLANLSYAYYWIKDEFKEIFGKFWVNVFIFINMISLAFAVMASVYHKLDKNVKILLTSGSAYLKKESTKSKSIKKLFFTKDVGDKTAKVILSVILLFSIVTRLYSLHLPREEYFDEVYHAFTARLILNGDPKAWEWWNPHPEGFAYEWTHPPLAKLGMVLGMTVFGENAFGWRIVQAVLGILTIYLVYLITQSLFKDKKLALLAAGILSLDGLFLVMNRIGMNDTYVVFFVLLSLYLYIKDKYLFAALAYGLALSSKWSAIYAAPIFMVGHFVLSKKISPKILWFCIIPPLVYLASYTVMFTTGHTWDQFIEVQKQMWWYHTSLVAEHPYTSPAWTWPFLIRPLYLYNGPELNNLVSRIYAFGNPFVFWFGIFSAILSFTIVAKERIRQLSFIIFAYLIFFIPWIASPRIMFLYHYLPSIPFLAIISAFVLRRFPKLVLWFFVPTTILFVYFYPHWTALVIPEWLDKSYYWFNSWR